MKTKIHRSDTRGQADWGWLKARHTFSFASYQNPERVHFGVLRVLNDDIVAGGKGFDTHPHDNMEIITIPITGALAHKDSMGNSSVINAGEVQVMSAGKGIFHSEYNANDDEETNILQIWVFPNKKNVETRYDQKKLDTDKMKNNFLQILSPNQDDEGVWIHQDAWFFLSDIDKNKELEYEVKNEGNGVYLFVISGSIRIDDIELNERDGVGISETGSFKIESNENSRLLLMDIPMRLT